MFSTAVKIDQLNDYLNLSEECVLPIKKDGDAYEVKLKKGKNELEPAKALKGSNRVLVGLSDCMTCSGCLTSAEEIILKDRGYADIATKMKEAEFTAVSISPQTAFMFAASYNLPHRTAFRKLACFLKLLGAKRVYDLSVGEAVALNEAKQEFYESVLTSLNDDARRKLPEIGHISPEDMWDIKDPVTILAGHCPGWTVYAEKTLKEEIVTRVSRVASSQQIQGVLIKVMTYLESTSQTEEAQLDMARWVISGKYSGLSETIKAHNIIRHRDRPIQVYHVATAPCYDKKIEAASSQLEVDLSNLYKVMGDEANFEPLKPVDDVLSTGDIKRLMEESNIDFRRLPEVELDSVFTDRMAFLCSKRFGIDVRVPYEELGAYRRPGNKHSLSGGFAEEIMKFTAETFFKQNIEPQFENTINSDYKEAAIKVGSRTVAKFIMAYGFRNIQNIVRKLKATDMLPPVTYIEVMACPGGCFNGAGQVIELPEEPASVAGKIINLFRKSETMQPTERAINVYNKESVYCRHDREDIKPLLSTVIPTLHRVIERSFTIKAMGRREASNKGAASLKW